MENKILHFQIFRFHLLPIENVIPQGELFPEKKLPIEELKKKKNEFFTNVLNELDKNKKNGNPIKLEHSEDEVYLFKIAQRKNTTITKNFLSQIIENEPYSYIIVNNHPEVQKIAISENIEAFSSPITVSNILKKLFKRDLAISNLNIEIEPLFNSAQFWDYVKQYDKLITYIDFQFIKPNMANIANALPEAFKRFAENVNSHESNISLKAPDKGALENINKKNDIINGLVNYSSDGGGNIKLKVKNLRKVLNTKDKPVLMEIRQLDLEGASQQVIKAYKTIIEK